MHKLQGEYAVNIMLNASTGLEEAPSELPHGGFSCGRGNNTRNSKTQKHLILTGLFAKYFAELVN